MPVEQMFDFDFLRCFFPHEFWGDFLDRIVERQFPFFYQLQNTDSREHFTHRSDIKFRVQTIGRIRVAPR